MMPDKYDRVLEVIMNYNRSCAVPTNYVPKGKSYIIDNTRMKVASNVYSQVIYFNPKDTMLMEVFRKLGVEIIVFEKP